MNPLPRVLLIEDRPEVREGCQELLEGCDFAVTACESVFEAIEVLGREEDFYAVISDYSLPDGTGLQILSVATASKLVLWSATELSMIRGELGPTADEFFARVIFVQKGGRPMQLIESLK